MMLRNRNLNVPKECKGTKQQEEATATTKTEVPQQQQQEVNNLVAVSDYVQDIFAYHKYRERFFNVSDYTRVQPQINVGVRAELVNWLVDVQEICELNHETLYLAVKLFDLFMDRVRRIVPSSELQLLASTAALVASKYDERSPPLIDDFIYMAKEAFDRDQMLTMERELLVVVGFDLGMPLSYRFLRRFARMSSTDMTTLTLARYILELSLMSLRFCRQSESKIAAACLFLARKMRGIENAWSPHLEQCCEYTLDALKELVRALNRMLLQRGTQRGNLNTIFRKYSHEIFFEVATIKPLQPQFMNDVLPNIAPTASSNALLVD